MSKAIVFDIDGTLLEGVSWLKITKALGASVAEHERIFKEYQQKTITYPESKKQLLGLWQSTGNANRRFLTDTFMGWKFKEGAKELVAYLRSSGYRIVIITGSVDLFGHIVAKRLGVPDYFANTVLEWDRQGNLINYHYVRDQAGLKLQQFQEFLAEHKLQPTDCVVIGDDSNDIELFKAAGRGIAVGDADPELANLAADHVTTLNEIISALS